jgi:rhamnosyltransferase
MCERRGASQRHETPRVAAVVVLYRPTENVLTNVDSYRDQVDTVIAIDNTEVPDQQFVARLEDRGVIYASLGSNKGIAAALNEGCRRARALGFDWALTLDQDSTATPGMVTRLSDCVELGESAGRIAIVAPIWQQVGGLPETIAEGHVELDGALTSGSLTNLFAFEELDGFREDLFIDRVDSEYCLRARRHGWRILQQRDAVLLHRMGDLRRVAFPVGFWVTDYSPLRRYYMIRNLLEVRREYGREFPAWMAIERHYWPRELVKIVLAETHRYRKARMMIRGWLDYRRGQFGKYEDLHPR